MAVVFLELLGQESLLLIFELEYKQESWTFDQVVSIVLGCTLDDLLIVLELIVLKDIASRVIAVE